MKQQNIFSRILSTKIPWYSYLVGFIVFGFVITLVQHFLAVTLGAIPTILLGALIIISLKAVCYFASSPPPYIPSVQYPTAFNANPAELNRFSQVLYVLKIYESAPDPLDPLLAQIVASVHSDADNGEDPDFLSNTIVSAADAIFFTAFLQRTMIALATLNRTTSKRKNRTRWDHFDLNYYKKVSIILHQYEHLSEADTNSLIQNRLPLYNRTVKTVLSSDQYNGNIARMRAMADPYAFEIERMDDVEKALSHDFSNILLIDSIYGAFIPYSYGTPLPASDPLDRSAISSQVESYLSASAKSLDDFMNDVVKYYFF